jgi:hypothetical protein
MINTFSYVALPSQMSAVQFIQTLDAKALSIDATLFDEALTRSAEAHALAAEHTLSASDSMATTPITTTLPHPQQHSTLTHTHPTLPSHPSTPGHTNYHIGNVTHASPAVYLPSPLGHVHGQASVATSLIVPHPSSAPLTAPIPIPGPNLLLDHSPDNHLADVLRLVDMPLPASHPTSTLLPSSNPHVSLPSLHTTPQQLSRLPSNPAIATPHAIGNLPGIALPPPTPLVQPMASRPSGGLTSLPITAPPSPPLVHV